MSCKKHIFKTFLFNGLNVCVICGLIKGKNEFIGLNCDMD